MSNRPCNKCVLDKMQREAQDAGSRIEVIEVKPNSRSSRRTGYDVFRVKEGQQPSSANWMCWMMELNTECAC